METVGRAHETMVDGVPILWGELGTGEPLVLLHGLLDSHWTWRRAAPLLARRFRVLMPDLPGHGGSGRPDASYTLAWHARMVADWMQAIGVEQADLCGHSFGGGVAQWMLLEQRARVRRLALVASGGLGREISPALRLAAIPLLGRALSPFVLAAVIPALLPFVAAGIGNMEPAERARLVGMIRRPGTARAFQRSLEGVVDVWGQYQQTFPRARELPELPPIALFWGRGDPVIPLRHGMDAVARASGITLVTYDRCGHYPHLDVAPRFAADALSFYADPLRTGAVLHAAELGAVAAAGA
jgi:pimeloyl-ACP methyl ester carboxylesterase